MMNILQKLLILFRRQLLRNDTKNISDEYLSLIKLVLIDLHRIDKAEFRPIKHLTDDIYECIQIVLDLEIRKEGKDWPVNAESMIGLKRMNNLEFCVKDTIKNNIRGDLIETGVWRGGACIFMRAILKAYDITDKIVWVADSFEGLPRANEELFPADKGDKHYLSKELCVSIEEVKNNFWRYNLLDNQVKFLKGWFKDTMPQNPIMELSILRLDGDMYESTIDVLINLYPKLAIGGYCIIDDWGAVPGCRKAVNDYRRTLNIDEEIRHIDWTGVFWKKKVPVKKVSRDEFIQIV